VRGAAKSLGDVIALFDRACALGDLDGCYYAGRLLLAGRGVARDASRGIQLLEQACDDGLLRACETLVNQHVAEHDAKSGGSARWQNRYYLQAQCLKSDGNACFYVGIYFDRGNNGFPHDQKRGADAYARGCDLGEHVSCNNLANDYYYGDGVPVDFVRAAQLYERACRDGLAIGCANVGFIAEYGDGVPLDMKRASDMYASGCSGQSAYACLHVAMLGEYRRGTPHEPAKAVERWRRACDAGDVKACTYLGVMYEDGKGVARDEARALAIMKKACTAKNEQGCAWMREHGGVP
jgi:TPR repeat protein